MKTLVRMPFLYVLLAFAVGCTRENAPATTAPPPDQASSDSTASPDAAAPADRQVSEPASRPPEPAPRQATRPSPAPAPAPRVDERPRASEPPTVATSPALVRPEPNDADRTPRTPAVVMQTVPAGTSLTVVMGDEISTATSKEGDTFDASLSEQLVVNGRVVAERGDRVTGRVEEVTTPGRVKGRAQLKLVLTELVANDRRYKVKTEPFVAIAVDNKERDAAIIAGGAGVGAAIGAITGGKKGAAIGAIVGGGSGTTAVLVTKGKDMTIEPETRVNFVTEESVALPVIRTTAS